MKVFLSGDTRSDWQSDVMRRFPGHSFFDPRTLSNKPYKEMAETELAWVDQSDIVFAYLNKNNPYGYGTSFEIGYSVANKKIVIYVDEKQVSSSKWVSEHPVYSFDTLDKGIAKLEELLNRGNSLIADTIVNSLRSQDFRVLVHQELDDELASMVAAQLYGDAQMYTKLMLASQMLPRRWYDWNLGYLLQKFNPTIIIENLRRYPENFYHSEGIAWALGLIGNDDEHIIKFLQEQCRRCEDYDAWWCAAHSLQQLDQGNAIEILKRTLTQPEWQDLDYCLEHIGSRPATIGLLRRIDRGTMNKIVTACLKSLRTLTGRRLHNVIWLLERFRLRDEAIVDALISFHDAKVQYGSEIAHRVVEALGVIAHPKSRELLEKDLHEAQYFRTRALAARGLDLIGDYRSIEPLEGALSKEKDPHVLSMVTTALYNIRDPEKKEDIKRIVRAEWLENGMIVDETNKWYWSPEIYDRFSHAEDPERISFKLALSLCPQRIQTALDIGSGTGRFVEELRESHLGLEQIYALDSSEDMIRYLRQKFAVGSPPIRPIQAAIADIPLGDASVDLVISSWGFPSKVWDEKQTLAELRQVYRVLRETGRFITIGWDEDFADEMTEVWHKFVMEEEYYFDSLSEYRRRKRAKVKSPRNCGLSLVKRRLQVPVKFQSKYDAADVFGHLFGYSAGVWVLENAKREFQMFVSITCDDKASLRQIVSQRKVSAQ